MGEALWSGIGEYFIGFVFLVYGLARKPLNFNDFNSRKTPLRPWAARLIYIPMGILFILFSMREITRALHSGR